MLLRRVTGEAVSWRAAAAVLLANGLGLGCLGCQWGSLHQFEQELRCGMSVKEVEALSQRFCGKPLDAVGKIEGLEGYAFQCRDTSVTLCFGDGGLQAAIPAHHVLGIAPKAGQRLDVCTGERRDRVELVLIAPRELAGAEVWIDGQRTVRVSSGPGYESHTLVWSGLHSVRVEKPDFPAVETQMSVPFGRARHEVQLSVPTTKPPPG